MEAEAAAEAVALASSDLDWCENIGPWCSLRADTLSSSVLYHYFFGLLPLFHEKEKNWHETKKEEKKK